MAEARRLWLEESGQDMIEYALVVGAVALVAVVSLRGLGAVFMAILNASMGMIYSTI